MINGHYKNMGVCKEGLMLLLGLPISAIIWED